MKALTMIQPVKKRRLQIDHDMFHALVFIVREFLKPSSKNYCS